MDIVKMIIQVILLAALAFSPSAIAAFGITTIGSSYVVDAVGFFYTLFVCIHKH